MAATSTSKPDPPIFTNYVNVPLSIDKLEGGNYDTWASDIKLWLKGQDYVDHLTQKATSIDEKDRPRWSKIDAQICSVLKSTIHPTLKQIFRAHETCAAVWEQARVLYTNDTQRLYGFCQSLLSTVASRRIDGSMAEYLGKIHGFLHDFNELLPPASTPAQELEQRQTFFMLMALYGLPDEYSLVRDQILGSPSVPTLTSTCSTLLRVPPKTSSDILSSVTPTDSSALVSQRDDRTRSRKQGKGRPKCDHCHKLGHTIDRCFALHGRPPRTANVAQASSTTVPSDATATSSDPSVPPAIFNDFLKWYKDRQTSGSTASVAHTGNSFVGPWVLDSGATDHITGNKSLFSTLSTSGYLPSVTMANGTQAPSHGIGSVHPLPTLPIDNVLYVPGSPFNLLSISRLTRSLDCVISFTKGSVFLQY